MGALLAAKWPLLILGAVMLVLSTSFYSYKAGKDACELRQAEAQLKNDQKVRKAYEKIDKETPFSADKSGAINWLLQHTRQQ